MSMISSARAMSGVVPDARRQSANAPRLSIRTTAERHTGMTSHRQTWTLIITGLGVFMTALDTLVVATALPALRADLGASLADLEWTVNAYNLAFACFLLTGAALGDRYGRK